jgi:hypothetical protein
MQLVFPDATRVLWRATGGAAAAGIFLNRKKILPRVDKKTLE